MKQNINSKKTNTISIEATKMLHQSLTELAEKYNTTVPQIVSEVLVWHLFSMKWIDTTEFRELMKDSVTWRNYYE